MNSALVAVVIFQNHFITVLDNRKINQRLIFSLSPFTTNNGERAGAVILRYQCAAFDQREKTQFGYARGMIEMNKKNNLALILFLFLRSLSNLLIILYLFWVRFLYGSGAMDPPSMTGGVGLAYPSVQKSILDLF